MLWRRTRKCREFPDAFVVLIDSLICFERVDGDGLTSGNDSECDGEKSGRPRIFLKSDTFIRAVETPTESPS